MGSVRNLSGRGTLFMDFRFQGKRCREYTALPDTPANRKRLERALATIEGDIANGTFDYAAKFPASRHAASAGTSAATVVLAKSVLPTTSPTQTLREFAALWLAEHQVEWRRSHIKVLKSTIDGHLLPQLGDKPVGAITKADVLALRATLANLPGRAGDKLSNKRINGILAPLRQILNDAADRHGFVSPTQALKPLKVRKNPTSSRSRLTRCSDCSPPFGQTTEITSRRDSSPACAPANVMV